MIYFIAVGDSGDLWESINFIKKQRFEVELTKKQNTVEIAFDHRCEKLPENECCQRTEFVL
jgi:hypothetical protein